MRYSTDADAKAAIIAAIEGGGEAKASEYDLDAIFDAAYTHLVDRDDAGNELLNTAGFELTVDDETFWEIVAENAR